MNQKMKNFLNNAAIILRVIAVIVLIFWVSWSWGRVG